MKASRRAPASSSGQEGWPTRLEVAAREVFELMLACPLETPAVALADEGLDIISMVGLAGRLCGVFTLRCKAKSASRMASLMLGIDGDEASDQMWDAVGEICNMVAGNFKNKIAGLGDGCMLSVPTVITGAGYRLHTPVDEEIRTVLLLEGEPIVLTLEIHNY